MCKLWSKALIKNTSNKLDPEIIWYLCCQKLLNKYNYIKERKFDAVALRQFQIKFFDKKNKVTQCKKIQQVPLNVIAKGLREADNFN